MIRNQIGCPVEIIECLPQNRVVVHLKQVKGKLIKHISELREDEPGEIHRALLKLDNSPSLFNDLCHEDRAELTQEGERAVLSSIPQNKPGETEHGSNS
jgi:hypothetical protein